MPRSRTAAFGQQPSAITPRGRREWEHGQEWKASEGKRAVSEATARRITDVMADNQAVPYVFGTRSSSPLEPPSAAKSGTT